MSRLVDGAHVLIESEDPEADRAFLGELLGLGSVDAGGGWLILALPPAEVALHPGKNGRHQLYLMCSDLDSTLRRLKERAVKIKPAGASTSWGRLATIVLPGGGELSIYEPKHQRPKPGRTPSR